MHIFFSLRPNGTLVIPIHYNHILQASVYNSIDPALAAFLHENGYQSGNRKFKLFTFSRLSGNFRLDKPKGTITFFDEIRLTVSSPVDEFCQSIANGMLTKGHLRLGKSDVEVEKMVVQNWLIKDESVTVRTLSPIVVYSTLLRPDQRKYTCYFQPGEPEFNSLVEGNLRKKYRALYGKEAPAGEVKVRVLGRTRLNIISYKNTLVKGYSGRMMLTGPPELLQMAVDAGVGSKNSQGFGCVEVMG